MHRLAERWCDLSPAVRLSAWLLMLAVLLSVSAITGRGPTVEPTPVQLQAQWRKMLPLRVVSVVTTLPSAKPFSALDYDRPGRRLASWQPAGKGGQLILDTDWPAIPSLFSQLAEQGLAVREFSIQPAQQHLTLTLQIEGIADD